MNHFRFKISDFQFEILARGRQVQSKIENIILLESRDVSEYINAEAQRVPALLVIRCMFLLAVGFFFSDFRVSLEDDRGLGAGMP